jgi:nitrous oxidase accessory protein
MRPPHRIRPEIAAASLALALLASAPGGSAARTLRATPVTGRAQAALAAAAPGDTVVLLRGIHSGPLDVRTRLVLRGDPGAVVHGGGRGTALRVSAPGTVLEDFAVRASGKRVLTIDSGIQLINSPNAVVRRVTMQDVLYGIYIERSEGVRVEGCRLRGRVAPLQEDGEGNGIHLWYTHLPRIEGNDVAGFTDAVYLSFVNGAEVRGNRLERNGRYGLHTMYCQSSHLVENHFNFNSAGCAIMFSNKLDVRGNDFWRNRGPRTYGLLLRDCSDGDFTDNRMVDNTVAVFMDNSNRNRLHGNLLEGNGWGILMFSSCARNEVAGNSFVSNDYPVSLDMRRTDNRFDDGTRGNYWSENAPYDLNGDGVSDVPFSPVTAFSFVSKQYPDLSILAKSPAVAALSVAERVMPALRPSAAVDRYPLVRATAARGTGEPLRQAAGNRVAAGAALGFGLFGLAGLAGLARVVRPRTEGRS